jgi:hypothetical protein
MTALGSGVAGWSSHFALTMTMFAIQGFGCGMIDVGMFKSFPLVSSYITYL